MKNAMKSLLIDNWREAYRFASMRANAATATGAAWWLQAAEADRLALLHFLGLHDPAWLVIIAIAANAVARVAAQPGISR